MANYKAIKTAKVSNTVVNKVSIQEQVQTKLTTKIF
jgi:hypothetical protein